MLLTLVVDEILSMENEGTLIKEDRIGIPIQLVDPKCALRYVK